MDEEKIIGENIDNNLDFCIDCRKTLAIKSIKKICISKTVVQFIDFGLFIKP